MESDAEAYSVLSKPQYKLGCDFVRTLQISPGDKVLDMGCGTGELTKHIASLVGPHGEVVGVDPDEARIKIAQKKFKDVHNLHFVAGDSSSSLPHEVDEYYYDLHFSSSMFHWLNGDQKNIYLQKANQLLKPGGRLAFLTAVKSGRLPETADLPVEVRSEAEYQQMCKSYSFDNVLTKITSVVITFPNFEKYKDWFRASTHRDYDDMDPEWRKTVMEQTTKIETNGSVTMEFEMIQVVGEKIGTV